MILNNRGFHLYKRLATAVILVLTTAVAASCQSDSDVDWLIDVLQLEKGSVVADIGAGDGDQTLAVARHIGPGGTIYSTELGDEKLSELREEIEEAGVENVKVLEGHPKRTNLPEECCDALYMRRVYHHISDPPSFNSSLYASLKPGGRLAVIDFEPESTEAEPGERASGDHHGVTAETVIEELRAAGFELVSTGSDDDWDRAIFVVMKKPEG